MADGLPMEFVNYLRAWPAARDGYLNKEVRRLYAMPAVHDRLEQLNIPSEQIDGIVRQQAAKNAQALAMQELEHMRQHYGVQQLTPDLLKAALSQHAMQFSPRDKDVAIASQFGRDAHADYAKQTAKDVDQQFGMMSSYVPFDETQAQGKPVQMPAEEISAPPGVEGAPKPTGGAQANPIADYMIKAAKQGKEQEAGQVPTDPVLPTPSSPMASAGGPNG